MNKYSYQGSLFILYRPRFWAVKQDQDYVKRTCRCNFPTFRYNFLTFIYNIAASWCNFL